MAIFPKSKRTVGSGSTGSGIGVDLFHYFDRFLVEYEGRFEKEYGFLRPIVKEVVERYLDCGNPRCGFARIRCSGCGQERLLMFSCRTRGFCPSCHAKRLEEWDEWMREELLLDIPHRQVVFTIPKMLRLFFKYKRRLLGDLCQTAVQALLRTQGLLGHRRRPSFGMVRLALAEAAKRCRSIRRGELRHRRPRPRHPYLVPPAYFFLNTRSRTGSLSMMNPVTRF